MIKFKELRATSKMSVEFINISFTIEDTVEDLTNYRFDLLRATHSEGPFQIVLSDIKNFECNDYTVNLRNQEIMYFFKIRAVNFKEDKELISDTFSTPIAEQDNYSFFFDEMYSQYLDIIGNADVYLLKRMRTGQRCDCYDDIRGSRMGDKCTSCFGTGYKGGFYQPIKMRVNYMNVPISTEDMTPGGSFEGKSNVQFWTTSYPAIQESDIIVDSQTGMRSIVASCQPSYKNGYTIRQTVQIASIPETSIIYKIPV